MIAVAQLINLIFQIYIWILIVSAVLSWLLAFGIVNRYNQVVNRVGQFCNAVTEPLLRPIRRVVPYIGGVDLSPMILILILWFARNLLFEYVLFP
jgi:YggT family protein